MKQLISADRLRDLLTYEPQTGRFFRRHTSGSLGRWKAGDEAGGNDGKGEGKSYIVLRLDERTYRRSRLAWLYMTGEWPKGDVDHKNGVRTDDCWSNLRDLTRAQNLQNKVASGAERQSNGTFHVRITVDGKRLSLGMYESLKSAEAAYLTAKRILSPAFATGRGAAA